MTTPVPTRSVADNVARVRDQIAAAARQAGRDPAEVLLVAASKTQPPALVAEAALAGITDLGENRVQEAAQKVPAVAELLGARGVALPTWRLIGPLQTNKAKAAIELFDAVDSVDRLTVAAALCKRVPDGYPPLPILLEVYVGDDAGRPGFRPDSLADEVGQLLELPNLVVEGLMTVAPLGWDEAATRQAFRRVAALRNDLARQYPHVHLRHLSMGMSGDFELAIQEGSTMVRIGTALFGARPAG